MYCLIVLIQARIDILNSNPYALKTNSRSDKLDNNSATEESSRTRTLTTLGHAPREVALRPIVYSILSGLLFLWLLLYSSTPRSCRTERWPERWRAECRSISFAAGHNVLANGTLDSSFPFLFTFAYFCFLWWHIVWKLLNMWHFPPIFCHVKTDLSSNTVWSQASGFQKLANFSAVTQNVNKAHFARIFEWDLFDVLKNFWDFLGNHPESRSGILDLKTIENNFVSKLYEQAWNCVSSLDRE